MNGNIYDKVTGVKTFWANPENLKNEKGGAAKADGGRKGAPCLFNVEPGETHVLAEAQGSGIIRHIWITFHNRDKPQALKGYKLEFFWDGADKPAVSVPLGDFFCFNSGKTLPLENEFFSNPEGRSFNCYIPMPFKTGMKVTFTNETKSYNDIQFYYQIDFTLGDDTSNALYFHAFYNREMNTVPKRDYVILPKIDGCGRYLGASFGVITNPLMATTWWGEGEVKCYIDGDNEYPTLAGTGVEDYIGTAWRQGYFVNRHQGCPLADEENGRYTFYRFHGPDPVYFEEDIKITVQQIGGVNHKRVQKLFDNELEIYSTVGKKFTRDDTWGKFERYDDDWCSVAYFYLDKPTSDLPQLPPYSERIEKYN